MKTHKYFRFTTREMALVALFAAVTAVFAQISIPMAPVPFTLGILGAMLSATVLETRLAVCSQLVYILLGVAGAPVFAGFQGGPHRILGPTGGFLASYILMALVIGGIVNRMPKYDFKRALLANAAGLLPCYILGAMWLGFSMQLDFRQTLMSAVLPFIPLDLVKSGLAAAVGRRLRVALKTSPR